MPAQGTLLDAHTASRCLPAQGLASALHTQLVKGGDRGRKAESVHRIFANAVLSGAVPHSLPPGRNGSAVQECYLAAFFTYFS